MMLELNTVVGVLGVLLVWTVRVLAEVGERGVMIAKANRVYVFREVRRITTILVKLLQT